MFSCSNRTKFQFKLLFSSTLESNRNEIVVLSCSDENRLFFWAQQICRSALNQLGPVSTHRQRFAWSSAFFNLLLFFFSFFFSIANFHRRHRLRLKKYLLHPAASSFFHLLYFLATFCYAFARDCHSCHHPLEALTSSSQPRFSARCIMLW